MKHNFKYFACLLVAVLCFGQVWATLPTSPTWVATALSNIADNSTVIIISNSTQATNIALPAAGAGTSNPPKVACTVTTTDGVSTITPPEGKTLQDLAWTIKKKTSTWQFFVEGSTTNCLYLTGTSSNTALRVGAGTSNNEFTMGSAGKLLKVSTANRFVGPNDNNGTDWRTYNSETGTNYKSAALTFYVLQTASNACAIPTFSPAAGGVASGTQVEISCSTDGASIHYTTDGTDPTASSSTYSSAITVNSEMTIKAIAVADGLDASEIATAAYTILTPKTIAQIMPSATTEGNEFLLNDVTVTYANGSNVYVKDASGYMLVYSSISGAANGKILQGLQGKAKLYSGLPEISTVTKAPTVTNGSAVAPEALTAYPVAADLNKYVTMEDVTFASAATLSGVVANVTGSFKGSDLIFRNTFLLSGVSLTAGTPYRVVGIVQKYNDNFQIYPISFEEIVGETQVATPTFSPAAGTYTEVKNVTISSETADATIYYTTNGDEPTTSSTLYEGAIEVGESMIIKAIAVKQGLDNSNVASATYTINLPIDENVAKEWDLSVVSCDDNPTDELMQWTATYVTMAIAKGTGTKVTNYYPGTSGKTYTHTRFYNGNTLTFTPNGKQITTITFIATSKDYALALANSAWTNGTAQASEKNVVVTVSSKGNVSAAIGGTCGLTSVRVDYKDTDASAPDDPTFSPAAGTYNSAQSVEISCTTLGATIYYTTDGTTPTSASTQYTAAISVEESMTIKAIAIKDSKSSSVASAEYTISNDSRKVAESPEGGFSSTSGDLSGNEISFTAYQGGSATAPNGSNTSHELRLYKYQESTDYGGYVTITAKSGCKIDQVVITVSANCNVGWCKDAEDLPTKESTPIAVSTSSAFDTGTGLNASSVSVVNLDGSNQFKIKTIKVYYTGAAVSLQSIAISGTASVKEYNDGDEFNPAGLVVTGHYSDGNDAVISEGITWAFDPATLSAGTTSVSVTATVSEITSSAFVVDGLTVNSEAPALTDYYEKVTESAGITEGTYLIVYEEGSVAFNGGLETLDATSNTIAVTLVGDKIGVTTATAASTFYIEPSAGTIKSASNKYIGVTTNSNGLKQSEDATAYSHTFSIDDDDNAVIAAAFEGSSMSLRYNTASNQARFRYYKDNGQQAIQLYKLHGEVIKQAAGLAWDPADDITLTVGDAFTAPTLLNPNNIDASEITITSSNTNLATVSEGVVSLVADATGTTTITATFAGNATYKPATVSYKIKVNPAHSIYVSSLKVDFGSVAQNASVADKVITVTLTGVDAATAVLAGDGASAFEFTPVALTASGDITISASSAAVGTFNATLTISDDASEAEAKVVNLKLIVVDPTSVETPISTSTKWVAATEISDGMQVLITGVKDEVVYAMGEQKSTNRAAYVATINGEGVLTPGEGTMAFTLVAQGDGTYAIRTSDGKYLYAGKNDANHLKTQAEVDVNAKWTITTTSAVATGSSNRNVMQFNGSGDSKLFSCYASASQSAIALYVKQSTPEPQYETARSGLEPGRFYTICMGTEILAIRGASFWGISKRDQRGSVAYLEEESAPYAAGKPFLFYATSDKLEVAYGTETDEAGTNGALHGTLSYMDDAALTAAGSGIYMMYQNAFHPLGTNNHLDANRAYLVYGDLQAVSTDPQSTPGRQVRKMPLQGNVATGIEEGTNADNTIARKVMIDGQLFILRGEKMYDATGAFVK